MYPISVLIHAGIHGGSDGTAGRNDTYKYAHTYMYMFWCVLCI